MPTQRAPQRASPRAPKPERIIKRMVARLQRATQFNGAEPGFPPCTCEEACERREKRPSNGAGRDPPGALGARHPRSIGSGRARHVRPPHGTLPIGRR